MVELCCKTFKCGRVDLLSRQKETFFRKQERKPSDTCYKLCIEKTGIGYCGLFGKMQNVIV